MDANHQLDKISQVWFRLVKNQLKLFGIEWKLAKLTIKPLIFCLLLFLIFLISTWVSIMCLIGYAIYLLNNNVIITLLSVAMINIVLIMLTYCFFAYLIKQGSFQRVRRNLRRQLGRVTKNEENI